jgi:hypothetical protein
MGEDQNLSTEKSLDSGIEGEDTTGGVAPQDTEQQPASQKTKQTTETELGDDEPPTRKEQAQLYYQKRQAEKAAKQAQSGLDETEPKPEIDPQIIKDVLKNELGLNVDEFKSMQHSQKVESELAKLIKENPAFKEDEDKIRTWANHPSRANVPVRSVAFEIAGEKLMKMGADAAMAAYAEANKTKPIGTTAKAIKKSVSEMSKDEFQASINKIING